MKVDSTITKDIDRTKEVAAASKRRVRRALDRRDQHDPFLQTVQAAEVTERVTLGTSIAIAFARDADDAGRPRPTTSPATRRDASCSGSARR